MSWFSRIDTSSLSKYLFKTIKAGRLEFISREVTKICVNKLSKLGGGISNDNYTFSLIYLNGGKMQELELVLKIYRRNAYVKCRNEGHILKALESKNFPVPHVYVQEMNEKFLGAPFIIMEKVKGKPMGDYLKKLRKKERLDIIRRFAETLSFLHELKWEDFGLNFLKSPLDEYDYARQQIDLAKRLKDEWNIKRTFDGVIDWLETKTSLHPCFQYSLLHGDMHLDNFLVTNEGKLVTLDWEYPEIGDPLKDVALAYHNLSLMLDGRNGNEGEKIGEYFIQQYIKSSCRKMDYSNLRFYILSTALIEAICYRFNSAQAFNPLFVNRILGIKYTLAFPLVWWYFRSKSRILERLLVDEVNSVKC